MKIAKEQLEGSHKKYPEDAFATFSSNLIVPEKRKGSKKTYLIRPETSKDRHQDGVFKNSHSIFLYLNNPEDEHKSQPDIIFSPETKIDIAVSLVSGGKTITIYMKEKISSGGAAKKYPNIFGPLAYEIKECQIVNCEAEGGALAWKFKKLKVKHKTKTIKKNEPETELIIKGTFAR